MDTAHIVYLGGLRTECTHVRSGQRMITDAPVDNRGKGEAFSPTDLLATSLAACIVTTMGIVAQDKDIPYNNVEARAVKHMASDPRRVAKVEVHVTLDGQDLDERQRTILRRTAHKCPVAISLAEGLEQEITLTFR